MYPYLVSLSTFTLSTLSCITLLLSLYHCNTFPLHSHHTTGLYYTSLYYIYSVHCCVESVHCHNILLKPNKLFLWYYVSWCLYRNVFMSYCLYVFTLIWLHFILFECHKMLRCLIVIGSCSIICFFSSFCWKLTFFKYFTPYFANPKPSIKLLKTNKNVYTDIFSIRMEQSLFKLIGFEVFAIFVWQKYSAADSLSIMISISNILQLIVYIKFIMCLYRVCVKFMKCFFSFNKESTHKIYIILKFEMAQKIGKITFQNCVILEFLGHFLSGDKLNKTKWVQYFGIPCSFYSVFYRLYTNFI